MPFVLIFAILIAFLAPDSSYRSAAPLDFRLSAIGVTLAAVILFAAGISEVTSSWLRFSSSRRVAIMRTYRWLRRMHLALFLLGYATIIHVLGWHHLIGVRWGLDHSLFLDELLVLLPLFLPLVASWALFYDVDCALRDVSRPSGHALDSSWSRWEYVSFHVRHELAPLLLPLVFLFSVQDLLRGTLTPENRVAIEGFVVLAIAGCVFFVFPVLLRVIWNAKPLPSGPLRDRLLNFTTRIGCGPKAILLWKTHHQVINAVVAGFVPSFRYVLLSDGLLGNLREEEVEAVLAHEVGHIYHRHLLLRLLCIFALAIVLFATSPFGVNVFGDKLFFTGGSFSLLFVRYSLALAGIVSFWVLFGFFSRNLERQADVFACRSTSCGRADCLDHVSHNDRLFTSLALPSHICPTSIKTLISSLENLAQLNGVARNAPSWQHSSVARRTAFLERINRDPHLERRFQHSVRRLSQALLLFLFLSLLYYLTGSY